MSQEIKWIWALWRQSEAMEFWITVVRCSPEERRLWWIWLCWLPEESLWCTCLFFSCPSIWSSHCQLWTVWTLDTPLLPVLWREKSCQPFVWYFYIQLNTLLLLKKENVDAPWCAVGGRRQSIAGERELGMLLRTKVASSPSSIFIDIFFILLIWTIISTGDHW